MDYDKRLSYLRKSKTFLSANPYYRKAESALMSKCDKVIKSVRDNCLDDFLKNDSTQYEFQAIYEILSIYKNSENRFLDIIMFFSISKEYKKYIAAGCDIFFAEKQAEKRAERFIQFLLGEN